jgi:hypothetical protein
MDTYRIPKEERHFLRKQEYIDEGIECFMSILEFRVPEVFIFIRNKST